MNKEQFETLQFLVTECWNEQGKVWQTTENNGFREPDPSKNEVVVADWANRILSSQELCVQELGYDSVAEYVKEYYE